MPAGLATEPDTVRPASAVDSAVPAPLPGETGIDRPGRTSSEVEQFTHSANLACPAADRDYCRSLMEDGEFVEVFVDTPLEVCEKRDPKGLYKKARSGEIKDFTGIDSAYEAPEAPEVHLTYQDEPAEQTAERLYALLQEKGLV